MRSAAQERRSREGLQKSGRGARKGQHAAGGPDHARKAPGERSLQRRKGWDLEDRLVGQETYEDASEEETELILGTRDARWVAWREEFERHKNDGKGEEGYSRPVSCWSLLERSLDGTITLHLFAIPLPDP